MVLRFLGSCQFPGSHLHTAIEVPDWTGVNVPAKRGKDSLLEATTIPDLKGRASRTATQGFERLSPQKNIWEAQKR